MNSHLIDELLSAAGQRPRFHLVRLAILPGIVERSDFKFVALPRRGDDSGGVAFILAAADPQVHLETAFLAGLLSFETIVQTVTLLLDRNRDSVRLVRARPAVVA